MQTAEVYFELKDGGDYKIIIRQNIIGLKENIAAALMHRFL
jgi:hypothetical protein